MSDGEQDHATWRTEHQGRAQAQAFIWAERATAEYGRATEHEDDARRNERSAYLRDAVADDRRLAQFHGTRSAEALKLAEMWAHVAQALQYGALPAQFELVSDSAVLDTTNG